MLKEIQSRLGFLLDVGLEYLSLSRAAATLSGGEAQRIRLATQIGSGLVGVLYVLDEPSIGLHQRDNRRLIETLTRLAGSGQHADRRRARRGHHRARRLGRRHRSGRRRARRPASCTAAPTTSCCATRSRSPAPTCPGKESIEVPAIRRPVDRQASAHRRRRPRAQPARHRRDVPARRAHRGHRACPARASRRWSTTSWRRCWPTGSTAPGRCPGRHTRVDRAGPPRQAGPRRPVADRPHAAIQPGHLHRGLRQDPHAVRGHHRGQSPRLPAGPILVQRQGRSLRGVHRRRHHQDRDELPARRVCARARSATVPATTAKPSRCTTRARPSPKCSTCRSKRRRSSSSRSPASTATCRRWSTSASGTCGWASRRRRCPAVRRSG